MDRNDIFNNIAIIVLFILLFFATSCSHNPAVFTFGKQVKIGTTEYGELTYLNGIAIVDCSRENSEWELEVDDETGIVIDKESNSIKGIKKIKRKIGPQVSGYLCDLAGESEKVAKAWVEREKPLPVKKRKGEGNVNLNGAAVSGQKEAQEQKQEK